VARRRHRNTGARPRQGRGRQSQSRHRRRLIPLPTSTASLIARWGREANAGLLFDKYPATMNGSLRQDDQRAILNHTIRHAEQFWNGLFWDRVLDRHRQLLRDIGATTFAARLSSPLCLHTARPGPLENAGLALHPIWGVPYLPGTGLKGSARAYATRLWLPSQPDRAEAARTIERIFGKAPSPWRKQWAQAVGVDLGKDESAAVGTVIFLEAWPTRPGAITIDILNNHHFEYYQDAQGEATGKAAPGDWENPMPVFFPVVAAGAEFLFAVAKRRDDVADEDLRLAIEWLQGALQLEGVGGKTSAGYGRLRIGHESAAPPPTGGSIERATYTLRLVSPAFLAGADQQSPESCELRGTTLRGLLRWWWRTLHAGYLTVRQLQMVERVLWGSTVTGSPIAIELTPVEVPDAELFDRESIHAQYNITASDPRTGTGLHYITYGMDERVRDERRRRWFIPAPATWKLTVTARPVRISVMPGKPEVRLSGKEVLEQFKAALWCLCHFGGVGSKARRGFGSFDLPGELSEYTLATVNSTAAEFRRRCQVPARDYHEKKVQSPSFAAALLGDPSLKPVDIPLGERELWVALNRVGEIWRDFLRQVTKEDRMAFGLPRRVRTRGESLFTPGPHVKESRRHASPVWLHLFLRDDLYWLRATFFPSPELPTLERSRRALGKLREYLVKLV